VSWIGTTKGLSLGGRLVRKENHWLGGISGASYVLLWGSSAKRARNVTALVRNTSYRGSGVKITTR